MRWVMTAVGTALLVLAAACSGLTKGHPIDVAGDVAGDAAGGGPDVAASDGGTQPDGGARPDAEGGDAAADAGADTAGAACLLPSDCDDDNPCTEDGCDLLLGCRHEPLTGDACPAPPGECVTGATCDEGECRPTLEDGWCYIAFEESGPACVETTGPNAARPPESPPTCAGCVAERDRYDWSPLPADTPCPIGDEQPPNLSGRCTEDQRCEPAAE